MPSGALRGDDIGKELKKILAGSGRALISYKINGGPQGFQVYIDRNIDRAASRILHDGKLIELHTIAAEGGNPHTAYLAEVGTPFPEDANPITSLQTHN